MRNEHKKENQSSFLFRAKGTRHSLGIDAEGVVYSWGKSSSLGQLGRKTNVSQPSKVPIPVANFPNKALKVYASVGSDSDSGHSAILDVRGNLWMTGCDRWQQLGLGSAKGGSTGYTWKEGKLWQEKFVSSSHVVDLIKEHSPTATIRDLSLGGDHTLILASNGGVYAFGKGGDGQLGLVGKPFLSAPVKSKLSSPNVAAVCAIKACSVTLNPDGSIQNKAGKCQRSVTLITEGITNCISRAKREGLIVKEESFDDKKRIDPL